MVKKKKADTGGKCITILGEKLEDKLFLTKNVLRLGYRCFKNS